MDALAAVVRAELAVEVVDDRQGHGIGARLVREVVAVAAPRFMIAGSGCRAANSGRVRTESAINRGACVML